MSTGSSEPQADPLAGVVSEPTASYVWSSPRHATPQEPAVTSRTHAAQDRVCCHGRVAAWQSKSCTHPGCGHPRALGTER